jgi:hypothetical protein
MIENRPRPDKPFPLRQLPPLFMQALSDRFNILDIIDLFKYDNCLDLLYTRLESLKKDTYNNNDRIILMHFDTDFYIHQDRPGFLLSNLHMILAKLDIPFNFILLITNHQLTEELEQLRNQYTTEPISISHIVTNFQKLLVNDGSDIIDLELNQSCVHYLFSCLNGSSRSHRRFLISMLDNNNLLSRGLISYYEN